MIIKPTDRECMIVETTVLSGKTASIMVDDELRENAEEALIEVLEYLDDDQLIKAKQIIKNVKEALRLYFN